MSIDTAIRLSTPTATTNEELRMDPRADVVALVAGLTDRERTILTDRLAAEQPATLAELGKQFGVSREWVRHLEDAVKVRLAAFPWVIVMAGVVPVYGQWIRHIDQIIDSPTGASWNEPILPGGPTTLQLLLAAEQFTLVKGPWLARRMSGEGDGPGRWIELIRAGGSGTIRVEEFLADLESLGLPTTYAMSWIESNGLNVRHGLVRSMHESLETFLVAELTAVGGTADFEGIMTWVDGRWSTGAVRNLLQSKSSPFARIDVKEYALASLGLPEYTSIREAIRTLLENTGPLPLADVVGMICDSYDVAATSVDAYARQRPFRVTDGIVDFRESGTVVRSRRAGTVSLADIPEGVRWRHVFFTPTGYAYRFVVNDDHLRGSGHAVSATLARIVRLRQGHVWEMPLDNVDATLKISRKAVSQPALGSIKAALDAQGAVKGDIAFIHFDGSEGEIQRVALTVVKPRSSSRDPFAEALMLVGHAEDDVEEPFDAICAALGVDADFAADLVEVATRRKDAQLAAVLTELAEL